MHAVKTAAVKRRQRRPRRRLILPDEDALDGLDQAVPLSQVGAGLMLGPEIRDLRLTHEGRRRSHTSKTPIASVAPPSRALMACTMVRLP